MGDAIVGKLLRIAPSIDPKTRKVEVTVIVSDPTGAGLVVGQNVSIAIAAKIQNSATSFLVPVQAVRIATDKTSVFTVNADFIVEEKPVTTGAVTGETVEVTSGLSDDMKIIVPVYGVVAGQTVVIQ